MEPMTLGSPSSLPGSGVSGSGSAVGYLPSFLMGDPPATPRPNTLSPTRARGSLAYGNLSGSPPDGMRSPTIAAFHHQQQQQQHQQQTPANFLLMQQQTQRFLQNSTVQASSIANQFRNESFDTNTSVIGPPTQGLFDSWHKEKQLLHTSTRGLGTGGMGPMLPPVPNEFAPPLNQSFNESIANQSGFNGSRVMSPIPVDYSRVANVPVSPPGTPFGGNPPQQQPSAQTMANSNGSAVTSNWITVFGFPPSATKEVQLHFSTLGTIIDKQLASQGGNWMHLHYSSRIECIRALNYNGRVISPGLMIGVVHCNVSTIVGKENDGDSVAATQNNQPLNRVRSLINMSHANEQDVSPMMAPTTPQRRGPGIVHKAMDLFFGW
ncbi:nucleoporin Nup35 [Anopheles bellator]|uniref:nucleoporin Nup35 n=1 Tax=Anopheles bellator TaxID=139047 RepID=UPI00264983D1|nr:nucleoporin Nup35 [Anopheles bellator]